MAAVAIRCGTGGRCSVNSGVRMDHRALFKRSASTSLAMNERGKKKEMTPISMSLVQLNNLERNRRKEKQSDAISYEKVIDGWMKESVTEIVKNLREAPLLVHVYGDGDGSGMSLKTEKAVSDNWLAMRSEWETGTVPSPQGVIFVEQLKDVEEAEEKQLQEDMIEFGREGGVTRAWGIVVQQKGENCRPACYLLKTVRAGAGSGLGMCCTHFCLVKVSSFRDTAETQFKNSWLVNGQ